MLNPLRTILHLGVLVALSCLSLGVQASSFPQELAETLKRYASAKSLQLKLEKKVILAALGRETLQNGRVFMKQGLARLEFDDPNRSLIVVDKQTIWVVSYPPAELGGDVQVAKARRSSKQSPVLLSLLSEKQNPEKDFKVVSTKPGGDRTRFELEPKKANPDFKKLRLDVNPEKKELLGVTYWDELENETQFNIEKTDFEAELKADLFEFKAPKGAKVSEY